MTDGRAPTDDHASAGTGRRRVIPRTAVFFHAHPDDEALFTAGTMARAADEGHRVVLVVATRGEVGTVGDILEVGETLGSRRERELRRSAELLGVDRLVLLGYGDSGLGGPEAGDPGAVGVPFSQAPVDEAAERVAAVLEEEAADALTVYDAHGGYGHPDHVQVHRVGHRAAQLAGTPLVLEATVNRDLMKLGVELAAGMGYDLPPQFAPETFEAWFVPEAELTHAIDVSAYLDRKRAAMAAHASQATGPDDSARSLEVFLQIPEEYFAMGFGTEWFVDPRLPPGITRHQLFDGDDLDGERRPG